MFAVKATQTYVPQSPPVNHNVAKDWSSKLGHWAFVTEVYVYYALQVDQPLDEFYSLEYALDRMTSTPRQVRTGTSTGGGDSREWGGKKGCCL
jgi:hypothetical protein